MNSGQKVLEPGLDRRGERVDPLSPREETCHETVFLLKERLLRS